MARKRLIERWTGAVALTVSTATLVGLLTGGFGFLYGVASGWLRREPRIVVRHEDVREFDERAEYSLYFSVVNRRPEPIILNSVTLRLGDYGYGSTLPMYWLAFKSFSQEIKITLAGHPTGRPFPLLQETRSADSMGSATFTLIQERGSIEPNEQVDVNVLVKLSRPSTLKRKYPSLWSLGGQIQVHYEDRSLNMRAVAYPGTLNRPFPF
jgi:hypothetical protein